MSPAADGARSRAAPGIPSAFSESAAVRSLLHTGLLEQFGRKFLAAGYEGSAPVIRPGSAGLGAQPLRFGPRAAASVFVHLAAVGQGRRARSGSARRARPAPRSGCGSCPPRRSAGPVPPRPVTGVAGSAGGRAASAPAHPRPRIRFRSRPGPSQATSPPAPARPRPDRPGPGASARLGQAGFSPVRSSRVASIAPASSLARRVSTLPRNGMMRRSGRSDSSRA